MKIKYEEDLAIELNAELWLPDADDTGFAVEGQQPEIAITEASGTFTASVTLRDLCRECITRNPNSDTTTVVTNWLRNIADDIEAEFNNK
ncbi:hypothetical protein [Microbulbifer sp. SAOS-129_SWC]|uniref:hypothetical protein n=1 Tax=Microbulbifer sp. SAOS-129_SWC TaxID=3145235 RepID=UPI0032164C26